jgi:hypothetical protein
VFPPEAVTAIFSFGGAFGLAPGPAHRHSVHQARRPPIAKGNPDAIGQPQAADCVACIILRPADRRKSTDDRPEPARPEPSLQRPSLQRPALQNPLTGHQAMMSGVS